MAQQQILIIVGPTSSGKSALGVAFAKKYNGEVISADSRQVYKGLDIGTGKITKREMAGIKHYMLDVASPKKTFSAHDYVRLARRAIDEIATRGKLPILVGGTGLYIDALIGRIVLTDVPPNAKLRAQLEKRSAAQLFSLLKKKDPRRAKTIEPEHKRRLIRALEIATVLGKNPVPRTHCLYDTVWIGIAPPIEQLERKIAVRLNARMRKGMIDEAKRLHASGLSYKRMNELGLEYRSLASLLQGKISRQQMTEELNRAIRKYAKRQMVYWKRNKDIDWYEHPRSLQIDNNIQGWLEK